MSEVKVNKISPRTNCGTVQLGDSGDTITIPAGVTITNNGTQTGFGRTGTVDWQTSIKTANFTATSGEGYFCNTTSGAFTVTLPASPSAGAIVAIKDYANTFDTNALTIGRNSSNIGGDAQDSIISTEGLSVTLVYADATKGWLVINDGLQSSAPGDEYVAATGGNAVITCGNFKIHVFTAPGTFCVSSQGNSAGSNTVDYMVVAGGGGGGGNSSAGGGGGGGFRESPGAASGCYTASPLGTSPAAALPVSVQGYPIAVGGGGPGGPGSAPGLGTNGSNSSFSTITSAGGGAGSAWPGTNANPGGSGGGAGNINTEGTGNQPPVNPPQGQPGQGGNSPCAGGGGGGATAAGSVGVGPNGGGPGGAGATTAITTSSSYGEATPTPGRAYAGGGGGRGNASATRATGGLGGGGNGNLGCSGGEHGTTNTGGGGGGNGSGSSGANGGSGIVIIRYKFQ
jgi:hypothetical protein